MPVMISSTAVTHENQLTCVCGSDTKLSLRVQKPGSTCAYVGSTCAYMNRAALANPTMYAFFTGQRGWTPDQFEEWLADSLAQLLLP